MLVNDDPAALVNAEPAPFAIIELILSASGTVQSVMTLSEPIPGISGLIGDEPAARTSES